MLTESRVVTSLTKIRKPNKPKKSFYQNKIILVSYTFPAFLPSDLTVKHTFIVFIELGRKILLFLTSPLQPFMPLANLRCSPDVHHFLCQAFIPACTEDNRVIRPCREKCQTVLSDCRENIRIFDVTWPPELQCDK